MLNYGKKEHFTGNRDSCFAVYKAHFCAPSNKQYV